MRFTLALALLTATLGVANPIEDNTSSPMEIAAPMEARDLMAESDPLAKRACVSNGCKCVKGLRQGRT